jgi:hypothetical protein
MEHTVAESLRAKIGTVKRRPDTKKAQPLSRCDGFLALPRAIVLILVSMNTSQLSYHLLADLVVFVHVAFVVFALLGGLLAARWRRLVWIHLPAVIWAAIVEFFGWVCPLTPLENWLRRKGGQAGYSSGFIAHYILPVLYPEELSREVQITLGAFVLLINLSIYTWTFRCKKTTQNT